MGPLTNSVHAQTRGREAEVHKARVVIAIIFVGLAFAVPLLTTGKARVFAGGLFAVIGVASLLVKRDKKE